METVVKNSKKLVFLVLFAAVIFSTLIYVIFALSFNHLGANTERFSYLMRTIPSIEEWSILAVGDSQVMEDIDCTAIDKVGSECFNLGVAGILPLQLALIKDEIAAKKPGAVLIGVSPLFFQEGVNKNDDLFFVLNNEEKDYNGFLLERFTEEEKNLLSLSKPEQLLYKRKFILSYYMNVVKSLFYKEEASEKYVVEELKTPFQFIKIQSEEELLVKINNHETAALFDIRNSSLREREAFVYLIRSFSEADISVVIVKMPLHPLIHEKVDKEAIMAFDRYIASIEEAYKVAVLDYTSDFAADEFTDLTHLNSEGRDRFSNQLSLQKFNK